MSRRRGDDRRFHNAIGAERIEARMIELATALKGGLEEAGLSLVTPRAAELSGGVVSAELEGRERAEVVIRLYEEHGIAVRPRAGSGCVLMFTTR